MTLRATASVVSEASHLEMEGFWKEGKYQTGWKHAKPDFWINPTLLHRADWGLGKQGQAKKVKHSMKRVRWRSGQEQDVDLIFAGYRWRRVRTRRRDLASYEIIHLADEEANCWAVSSVIVNMTFDLVVRRNHRALNSVLPCLMYCMEHRRRIQDPRPSGSP